MSNFIYTVAIVFIMIWALGLFAFHVGDIIHVFLVLAIIAILFRLINGKNPI